MMGGLIACGKQQVEPQPGDEFVLEVDGSGLSLSVDSKASAITSMPSSLYWCATTGTSGSSDALKYAPTRSAVSSGRISTGKYQTAAPASYNWYVSNASMSIASGGPTVSVTSTDSDYLAGCAKASVSATPEVGLRHILARSGTLTFNTQSDYAVSGVSWVISRSSSGTSGTYNIATDSWTPAPASMSPVSLTGSSDLYLLPGEYTVTITYTLSRENYSETFTRSGSVTLLQGMVNDLTATANGGAAVVIAVSPSLSGWSDGAGSQLVM